MLDALLQHPLTLRLGWTLVHSLWQGALLAGLLGLGLALLTPDRNRLRHTLASAVLILWLAAPPVTFLALAQQQSTSAGGPITTAAAASVTPSRPSDTPPAALLAPGIVERVTLDPVTWSTTSVQLRRVLPYAALAWIAVATLMTLRLLGGLLTVHDLRRTGAPLPHLEDRMRALAARLGLTRRVRLRSSIRVDAPTALGWLKPVILLPTSTLAGLTPQQLELILAHELAHVRRHDYLVNVLQGVAEALLFFHPLTWWLSRALRVEREHACDTLALHATGAAPLELAEALTRLEGARATPAPALAATGNLAERVRRLLRSTRPTPTRSPALIPLLALVPLSLWLAFAATPPASAESFFERQPNGRLTGIYFEPPPGGWGSVMPLRDLIARSPYPVHAATHIPEGYRFDNATWIQAARTATLTYDGGPADGSLDARHVTLLQALTGEYRPLPIGEDAVIEPVVIGSTVGEYVVGNWTPERTSTPAEQNHRWESGAGQMLAWQHDGKVFAIGTNEPAMMGGAGVGRDDLIRVALGLVATHAATTPPQDTVHLPSDKTRIWATVQGDVTFTPDRDALTTIGEGGSVTLEERSPEGSRRVIVTTNTDGEFEFQYRVNGQFAPFEEAPRAWFEATMTELVFAPLGLTPPIDPNTSNYYFLRPHPDRYLSTIGLQPRRYFHVDLQDRHVDRSRSPVGTVAVLEQLTHAAAHGLIDQGIFEIALHHHLAHTLTAIEIASFQHAISNLDSETARQRLNERLQAQIDGSGP